MRKKIGLVLILIIMLFSLSGCFGGSSSDESFEQVKTYYTTVKVVNSSDEIIKSANVTVNGKSGEGSEGMYSFKLKKGTHTVKITDSTDTYLSYEGEIAVMSDNELKTIPLSKDEKTVSFEVLDKNNKPIENAVVSIENINPLSIENNIYTFNLDKNKNYTVSAFDEQGNYLKQKNSITVSDKTNYIFNLEEKIIEPQFKRIQFKVLDQSDNPISNATLTVEGANPSAVDGNTFYYDLEIGKSYSVTAGDENNKYSSENMNITIDENTDNYTFNLEQLIKEVSFEVLDQSDNPISNPTLIVEGVNPSVVDGNTFYYDLEIGKSYSVTAGDENNKYSSENMNITIDENTDNYTFNLEQLIKEVSLEVLDQSDNPISNATLTVEGAKPSAVDGNTFYYDLEIGKTYSVTAGDSENLYISNKQNISITESTDNIIFNLEEQPKVNVSGYLYLDYNSLPLQNVEVRYKNKSVITNEQGYYELNNIPKGERNLEITSLFHYESKNRPVSLNSTNNNENFNLSLPQEFEMTEWNNLVNPVELKHRKDKEVKYFIEEDLREYQQTTDNIVWGIEFIEDLMSINNKSIWNFNEVSVRDNADLVFEYTYSGYNALVEQTFEGNYITYSVIQLNPSMLSTRTVAHEIGHALGFDHSEGVNKDDYLMDSGGNVDLTMDLPDKMIFGLSYSLRAGESL